MAEKEASKIVPSILVESTENNPDSMLSKTVEYNLATDLCSEKSRNDFREARKMEFRSKIAKENSRNKWLEGLKETIERKNETHRAQEFFKLLSIGATIEQTNSKEEELITDEWKTEREGIVPASAKVLGGDNFRPVPDRGRAMKKSEQELLDEFKEARSKLKKHIEDIEKKKSPELIDEINAVRLKLKKQPAIVDERKEKSAEQKVLDEIKAAKLKLKKPAENEAEKEAEENVASSILAKEVKNKFNPKLYKYVEDKLTKCKRFNWKNDGRIDLTAREIAFKIQLKRLLQQRNIPQEHDDEIEHGRNIDESEIKSKIADLLYLMRKEAAFIVGGNKMIKLFRKQRKPDQNTIKNVQQICALANEKLDLIRLAINKYSEEFPSESEKRKQISQEIDEFAPAMVQNKMKCDFLPPMPIRENLLREISRKKEAKLDPNQNCWQLDQRPEMFMRYLLAVSGDLELKLIGCENLISQNELQQFRNIKQSQPIRSAAKEKVEEVYASIRIDNKLLASTNSQLIDQNCWEHYFSIDLVRAKQMEIEIFYATKNKQKQPQMCAFTTLNFGDFINECGMKKTNLEPRGTLFFEFSLNKPIVGRKPNLYQQKQVEEEDFTEQLWEKLLHVQNEMRNSEDNEEFGSSAAEVLDIDQFRLISVLGDGRFGILSRYTKTGEYYAIKIVNKTFSSKWENEKKENGLAYYPFVKSILAEKRVLEIASSCKHPFLINLFATFQTKEDLYFVMEHATGGDLYRHFHDVMIFTEERACFYGACVLLGLEFLHTKNIAYRYLKMETLILDGKGYVKLTDFQLCKEGMGPKDRTTTLCGQSPFLAPELLRRLPYTRAIDWWNFGLLIYEMLVGQSPFCGDDKDIFDSIVTDEIYFPPFLSTDVISIIRGLMRKNPTKRLGYGEADANEIKKQSFFMPIQWEMLLNRHFRPTFMPNVAHPEDVSNYDEEYKREIPQLSNEKISDEDNELFKEFDYCNLPMHTKLLSIGTSINQTNSNEEELITDEWTTAEREVNQVKTSSEIIVLGDENFRLISLLGKGHFAKVILSQHKNTGHYYAIKILNKCDLLNRRKRVKSLMLEKKILQMASSSKHPFLINLFATFQTGEHVFFVLEYGMGGDLKKHLVDVGRFGEERACFYAACAVLAIEFLHSKNIAYRDLKLANLILDGQGYVKLIDFNLCKEGMGPTDRTSTFCGTPTYCAPEMERGKSYTRSIDWWALGVLIYKMLVGYPPFNGDPKEISRSIINDPVHYPRFLSKSVEAMNIMRGLMRKNPAKRFGAGKAGANEIKNHRFFMPIQWELLLNRHFRPTFVPKIAHPEDVSNFDEEFTQQEPRLSDTIEITDEDNELFKEFDDFCNLLT